jgi:mRNA interferase MazF
LKRGEIWWADLGPYRPREQTGRRPVIIWQSDALTRALQSVLVVPVTTNLDRARLAGTAMIEASEDGLNQTSVALAFQMRAVPKAFFVTVFANSPTMSFVSWSWQPTKHWDG